MSEEQDWNYAVRKRLEDTKNTRMTNLEKIIDKFCREIWNYTINPGGAAVPGTKMYELYSGEDISNPKTFVMVITQKEILNHPAFKQWYETKRKKT